MTVCIDCIYHYVLYRVARPSQIYFTGEVKGESAMKVATDAGSPIDYEFRVTTGVSNTKQFQHNNVY